MTVGGEFLVTNEDWWEQECLGVDNRWTFRWSPTISVHSWQQVDVWNLSNTELCLSLRASLYSVTEVFPSLLIMLSKGCQLHPCWLVVLPSCSLKYECEISHCHRADFFREAGLMLKSNVCLTTGIQEIYSFTFLLRVRWKFKPLSCKYEVKTTYG